jgi:hypothetical protein
MNSRRHRTITTVTGLALVLGLSAALAGCGTTVIDGSKAEKKITALVSTKLKEPVSSVKCPDDKPAKKGASFLCQLTLKSGETVPFRITPTDKKGDVELAPADMVSTYVQDTITKRLAADSVKATVQCPRHVAVKVGATFDCNLQVPSSGEKGAVTITINSTDGGFQIGEPHST